MLSSSAIRADRYNRDYVRSYSLRGSLRLARNLVDLHVLAITPISSPSHTAGLRNLSMAPIRRKLSHILVSTQLSQMILLSLARDIDLYLLHQGSLRLYKRNTIFTHLRFFSAASQKKREGQDSSSVLLVEDKGNRVIESAILKRPQWISIERRLGSPWKFS